MKRFVFRNATVEPFFPRGETEFSGYGDVSRAPADAEIFRWFYALPPDAAPGEARALVADFLQRLRLAAESVPAPVPAADQGFAFPRFRAASPAS